MKQLTSLDLSGHAAISDASIAEIARHLTALTQLDLRKPACDSPGSAIIGNDGILALSSLTLLESVRLSQAQVRLPPKPCAYLIFYRMYTCIAQADNAGGQGMFAEGQNIVDREKLSGVFLVGIAAVVAYGGCKLLLLSIDRQHK